MYDIQEKIVAGITGTLFMTAALYLLAALTKGNFKVVGILGTMVTNHTTSNHGLSINPVDIIIGTLLHYLIGIFFAFIYYYLWDHGFFRPDFSNTILLGFINGCFAAVCWVCFIHFHKNPLKLSILSYVSAVGISHILFSIGVYLIHFSS